MAKEWERLKGQVVRRKGLLVELPMACMNFVIVKWLDVVQMTRIPRAIVYNLYGYKVHNTSE